MGRSFIKIYGGPKRVKERNIHGKISKSIRFGWIKKIQKNLADTDIEELLLKISKSVSDVQLQYQLTKTNPNIETDQEMMDSVNSMNILIQQLVETLPRNEVENLFEVCPSGSESEFEGVREPTFVCVGGLPSNTTKNETAEFFSKSGTVLSVQLRHNSDGTLGALVEFQLHEEAKKALKLNGMLMGNNPLYVSRSANNRRVFFVSGFHPTDSRSEIVKKIKNVFDMGDVWKIYFPPNERFAYVLIELPEEVDQDEVVQQLDRSYFGTIFVKLANLKKRFGEAQMNIFG